MRNFTPNFGGGKAIASVTTTTASVEVFTIAPTQHTDLLLLNSGAETLFVRVGDSTVEATAADLPLLPGMAIIINPGTMTHVAALTAANTSTLLIMPGVGS